MSIRKTHCLFKTRRFTHSQLLLKGKRKQFILSVLHTKKKTFCHLPTLAWAIILVIHRWQMSKSEAMEENIKVPGIDILGKCVGLGLEERAKTEKHRITIYMKDHVEKCTKNRGTQNRLSWGQVKCLEIFSHYVCIKIGLMIY